MVQEVDYEKRQRFHVVQLAMFNADVLARVQEEADKNAAGKCRQIIDQSARRNIAAAPPSPSTINQSLYFAMAYLSLVWLREKLSDDEVSQALASKKMVGVWDDVQVSGPRDCSSNGQKLRLVRNALSHSNVSIDDEFVFSFWDQKLRGKIKEPSATFLRMTHYNLGHISTQFYFAVSDVYYS